MSQFNTLSLGELEKAKEEIEELIKLKRKELKSELLRNFREQAEKHGIDFQELVAPIAKKSKSPAKYRNPDNHKETWTGRGRQPQWVQDQIARGKTLQDLAAI